MKTPDLELTPITKETSYIGMLVLFIDKNHPQYILLCNLYGKINRLEYTTCEVSFFSDQACTKMKTTHTFCFHRLGSQNNTELTIKKIQDKFKVIESRHLKTVNTKTETLQQLITKYLACYQTYQNNETNTTYRG